MLTTLPKINKILEISEGYEGVKELSDVHLHMVDFYNTFKPLPRGYRVKYSDSWCAVYVSVVMRRAGILDFPVECGVFEMLKLLQAKGCYIIGRFPMPGEIVFFRSSHVGIVNGWIGEDFMCPTIEGNTGNACLHRKHDIRSKDILGWCSPYRYSREEISLQINGNVWGIPNSATCMDLLKINDYV